MDVGNPAGDRIVDRDHGQCRIPVMHGSEGIGEGVAGHAGHRRIRGSAGDIGIRTGRALKGDQFVGRCHRPVLQITNVSRCVLWPWRRSGLQDAPSALKVGRSIDTERNRVNADRVDPHTGLKGPQLLKFLALFKDSRWQGDEPL